MSARRRPQGPSPFLSNAEAAAFLGVSPRTVEKYRRDGRGPRFYKFGRRVLYARSDLERWTRHFVRSFTESR